MVFIKVTHIPLIVLLVIDIMMCWQFRVVLSHCYADANKTTNTKDKTVKNVEIVIQKGH